MRCPKCSYTSFDHLVTCEKCGRDLTEIVDQLHGTSLKVESPMFLGSALEAPAGDEMLDIGGNEAAIPDLAVDEEVVETAAEEVPEALVADKVALEVEPEIVAEAPEPSPPVEPAAEEQPQMEAAPEIDEVPAEAVKDIKLSMEAVETEAEPQGAPEEPGPAAEATPEVEEKISLDFEGLDLSDLTPEDAEESSEEGGGAEEGPLDLWALDSSADEDLSDLFEDLVPAGQGPKKDAAAGESPVAKRTDSKATADEAGDAEGDTPKKDDT